MGLNGVSSIKGIALNTRESFPMEEFPINLNTKCIGKPSEGKLHAGFEEAGIGNVDYKEVPNQVSHLNITRLFSTLRVSS